MWLESIYALASSSGGLNSLDSYDRRDLVASPASGSAQSKPLVKVMEDCGGGVVF